MVASAGGDDVRLPGVIKRDEHYEWQYRGHRQRLVVPSADARARLVTGPWPTSDRGGRRRRAKKEKPFFGGEEAEWAKKGDAGRESFAEAQWAQQLDRRRPGRADGPSCFCWLYQHAALMVASTFVAPESAIALRPGPVHLPAEPQPISSSGGAGCRGSNAGFAHRRPGGVAIRPAAAMKANCAQPGAGTHRAPGRTPESHRRDYITTKRAGGGRRLVLERRSGCRKATRMTARVVIAPAMAGAAVTLPGIGDPKVTG